MGLYVGNNIAANSSPIVIGNRAYAEIGGSAIGHNVFVNTRHTDRRGSFLPNDSGFGIGENIEGHGNHLFMGRNITVESTFENRLPDGRIEKRNIANQATRDNRNSVYVGQNITTKGARESVLMGYGVTSENDVAHRSVGVGANITLGGDTASATALGSDLSVNGKYTLGVGTGVRVSSENAIGIGRNTVASADSASALGLGANATANNATAIGRYSVASATDSVALGRGAKAETTAGDVAIGSESVTSSKSTLSEWNVGGTN